MRSRSRDMYASSNRAFVSLTSCSLISNLMQILMYYWTNI